MPCLNGRHPPRSAGLRWAVVTLLLACLPNLSVATPARAPDQLVEEVLVNTKEAILARADALADQPEAAEALIRDRLLPRIGTRATARFVAGQTWDDATATERERFHEAFTRHVTATYALLLHRFADEVVQALKRITLRTETVRQGDQTALVRAFFRLGDGPEGQARVHLHARDGQWRLFDAEYAGFSLLRIWQAEIQGRLRKQSLPELIDSLQQRHTEQPPLSGGRTRPDNERRASR